MICTAKIKPPATFAEHLARKALLEEIQNCGASLLVLHGKAGYGKTELARQLCADFAGNVSWYRLDASDNAPKQFVEYLNAVCSDALPGYAGEKEEAFFPQLLLRMQRALETEGKGFLLVLDSFETICNEEVLWMVRRLAAQSCGGFRLCIITRGRIPAFLSRFVVNGSCKILDEQELAFSREEEKELLRRLLPDKERDIKAILEQMHGKLGGWPAGVMLAGLFFRKYGICNGQIDWQRLVRTSMIGGFLESELFGELEEEERAFLIQTADMEELDEEVCDVVLGREDSRTLIQNFLEKDILCYRTAEEGAEICRHPIVELYLESSGNPRRAADTACRAAEYSLERRHFLKAAKQAAGLGHTTLVLTLMEQFGAELFGEKQWEALEICVCHLEQTGLLAAGKVPDGRLAGRTEVLGTAAQYYYRTGRIEQMEHCFNQADSVFGKENKFGMYRALYRGLLHYKGDAEKNHKLICNTLFLLEENHYPLPYLKQEDKELLSRIREGEAGEKKGVLKVAFFGDFRAEVDGEGKPLSFRTRKGGELFAYMLKRNGKPVGRKQLLAVLWNDELPENAVAMLHNMFYNLRKELSAYQMENLIEYKDKEYRVHMELVETDLDEIDRLCRMADQNDHRQLLEHQERFKTYWGRYLEDMDGFWAMEDREYYDTRFMKGCSILAKEAVKSGRPGDGALFYKNAMLVNGYSEEWEAGLLKCYGMMGNLKQVKNEYERFCAYIKKELRTGPGERLNRVYREIIEGAGEQFS